MKEQKHTPGPWTVDEEIEAVYVVIRNTSRDPVALGYLSGWNIKTARANARLIAAAPELLEACKYTLEHKAVGEQTPAGDLLDKVEAAIAKVEGN